MSPASLIIVCCHGIWLGGPSNGYDESEWLIADFQKGETGTFVEHIIAGIEQLAKDSPSALVFSGGPTRKETPLSEAQSYYHIAHSNKYWSHAVEPSKILLEERALDSYQNILFSLTLFYKNFARWPRHVTIVSHAFKRPRLIDGHCIAIGLPLDRISFLGIDPESMRTGEKEDALAGVKTAVGDWEGDPHGRGSKLRGKRRGRNVHGVWQGLFEEGFDGRKTGLVTRGEGEDETIEEDAPRPWL